MTELTHTPERHESIRAFIVCLAVTFCAAAAGGIASADAPGFYQQLTLPAWAPPAGAFGPVWTVLYLLMGIAAWQVWRVAGVERARAAFVLFLAQLVANGLWTWLFFAWRQGAWAFAEILLLLVLIVATIAAFGRHSRLAAALLVPYLLWVGFATALTFSSWQLNPQLLG